MSGYPNTNNETEFSKIKTTDDGIKNLKYQTGKNDHEFIIKS